MNPAKGSSSSRSHQEAAHEAVARDSRGEKHGRDARHGSARDRGVAGVPGLGARVRGAGAGALPAGRARRRGAQAGRPGALLGDDPLPEHHPARPPGPPPGRPGDRAPDPLLHPLERARHRAARQQGELGAGRPHRELPVGATLYDTGFMHFWHAPPTTTAATSSSSRGTARPGIYARSFLEGRLSEEQPAALSRGGRTATGSALPAPLADAGLLAVPDRLDGPRAR
jgi:hypothetical protein